MSAFSLSQALAWIKAAAQSIDANAAHLSELDAAIGDGDHGANMARGMAAVTKKIDSAPPADLAALFKSVGMTLLSSVGGASGPLYGGFFLELGKQSAGKTELDAAGLAAVLGAGLGDIRRRGKAEPGDKTMVDALIPAIDALAAASDLAQGTAKAAETARAAATATAPMLARKGRASYLGERSIGHQDPGANSVALLFAALAQACA
ncbi:dihydroxyacetone kinase subunit DhaL [Magnetospirillum aberrantis]|uniref:Dihydroxyacetone kinase subunit L n=1 Tax=Magnetospirillum aberrantis SpK TaxID=908842 RepID=A0A7C9V073_9PROT|nr:dihydroxyacetone kinase subunit DhaL [Magnetospirillum aberrantis]NFV81073.1 dihydroxyacetone kinase subunit L [Magnetospirillum aberrantis SpK]